MNHSEPTDQPQVVKAFYCPSHMINPALVIEPLPSLLFGTLFIPSNEQALNRGIGARSRPIDLVSPEVAEMVREGYKILDLPTGWRVRTYLTCHLNSLKRDFAALWFEVGHGLDFKHPRGGRMPEEILWLFSGSLQTGEGWSYCNFRNYCQLEGLKFLPFVINHDHFRFFVFRPNTERVKATIKTFSRVLEIVQTPTFNLTGQPRFVLHDVRMDEIEDNPSQYQAVFTKPLAFVYRDLKGPQAAVRFIPE